MSISPPKPRTAPLKAMRAFEAAARHGSFTTAADELCVTPGAVAQQVKALESWAGARLFERRAHGVRLTELGAAVLPGFVNAFDSLAEAVQSLRSRAAPEQIRIAALPSVAQLWLSPRLPAIRASHDRLEISVVASETPPNLKREPFDLSIFFEDVPGDPGHVEICRDSIFPVCAPHLAQRIRSPADLAEVTCLHDASWSSDWETWLQASCPDQAVDTRGPSFSLYSLMLEEACNGAGVMMGHAALVSGHIESGSLVAPLPGVVQLERRLAIATPTTRGRVSTASQVIDELLKQ